MSRIIDQAVGRRACIPFVFLFAGGAVGGLALLLLLVAYEAALGEFAPAAALELAIFFAGFGAVIGAPSAFAAGIVYAVLPPALQRIVVAPVVGAAATFVVMLQTGFSLDGPDPGSSVGLLCYAGAVAAVVCATFVRLLRLDAWAADAPA